jgi:uncharacterized membrane protein (DUF4010 family)
MTDHDTPLPATDRRPLADNAAQDISRVAIVDVHMPFWSMVIFLVKVSIASIPAMIILYLIGMLLSIIFGGIFSSFSPSGTSV